MAGLTPEENVGKALLLMDEAISCLKESLREEPVGHSRTFPYPEMRHVLRSLRRAAWDLEHCSERHPPYIREYTGSWHE